MSLVTITNVWGPASATAPAGPYDLTTLVQAKIELGIRASDLANDAWLSRAIAQDSLAIANYCNRRFVVEGLTDTLYLDPSVTQGKAPIRLSRWPLVNLVTLPTSADTPSGEVLPFISTTGVIAGAPSSGGGGVNLATIETGATIPANTTVSSIAANTSVTLNQPLLADLPEGSPVTFGLSVWQLQRDGTLTGLTLNSDYTADVDTGELYRLDSQGKRASWENLPTSVAYYAGYATIPADVEDACLRLLTNRWYSKGRDPSLREVSQPNIGSKVYWVGGPPKSGSLPEEIAGLIDKYRVPVAL